MPKVGCVRKRTTVVPKCTHPGPSVLEALVDLLAAARLDVAVEADVHGVEPRPAADARAPARESLDRVVAGARLDAVAAIAAQPDRVVAVLAEDPVAARAALQVVVAGPAVDQVSAAAAIDRVVPVLAVDHVGAERAPGGQPVAPDHVVAAVAEDVIGPWTAEQVVIALGAAQRAALAG